MSDTDALTADDLSAIRARHRPAETAGRFAHQGCAVCHQAWPCDAARLLATLDAATASRAVLEADYDQAIGDLTHAQERLSAAECRLPTKDGRTIVVTAAALRTAHQEARELCARAQFWAAGWRRAAVLWRTRYYDNAGLLQRYAERCREATDRLDAAAAEHDAWLARAARAGMFPAEVAAVVEAARALAVARLQHPHEPGLDYGMGDEEDALCDALAAHDAATGGPS